MEKEPASRKTKNPSKPKPDGLKPKAMKWKKKLKVEKQKKIHQSPNPIKPKAIKWEKKLQYQKQKNASKPECDGLKPKAVKWKKKLQVEKKNFTKA